LFEKEERMGGKHLFVGAIVIISLSLFGPPQGHAASIVRQVDFSRPVVTYSEDACAVSVEGLSVIGDPGEPLLPALGMRILLPQGEEVAEVNVRIPAETEIPLDQPLQWAQQQSPLSIGQPERVQANDAIYESATAFPDERAVHVTTETFRGYRIAFLRLYPVTYIGAGRKILYSPVLEVTVETARNPRALSFSVSTLRPNVERDMRELRRLVDDVSGAWTYTSSEYVSPILSALDPGEAYPYVIITDSSLVGTFEPVRAQREAMGLKAKIVHTGEIDAGYPGIDLQDKIRNFIKDAYLNWETEYVLLGGDEQVIPHRGLYADAGGGYTDDDIASDLYYGALDGTWNDDEDPMWGEPEEADLIPEVCVGRASVESETEATNLINKLLNYENSPVVGQIKVGQMVGELLWADPTWGGDYKDEIKDGSAAHGYTTVGFPPSFTVHTLYDRDIDPDRWDKDDLIPLLNGGRHLVNHLGHSDVTYGLRMVNSDVETRFTNDGVSNTYFIMYTQGCYSGSFDNRTSGGSYTDDCLGEHFTFVENAAVAFIGNTRYGWGSHGSTRGANQYYDRQFFDAVFGEDITVIGKANDDSKVDNIPFIDIGPNRWVYYQLVLLGDPAMDIWTDIPQTPMVSCPHTIYVSDNEISVSVSDGLFPIEGARVSIFSDDTYNHGYTAANGTVYLDPIAAKPGSLYVAVRAHNFYSYLDTVSVVIPTHAVVIIDTLTIDDDMGGSSQGNSSGRIDAGETIETVVTLKNVGQDSASSTSAELECADPVVSIIDSTGVYGDIAPDSLVTPLWSYLYQVSPDAPDSHTITFDLEITHSDTSLTKHFSLMLSAPVLSLADVSFADTLYGNGDDCIQGGETIEVVLSLRNTGSGDAQGVSVILTESDPYVTIEEDSAYVALIDPDGQGVLLPPFVVTVVTGCPEFHEITFGLDIHLANGRQAGDSAVIAVGGSLEDDFETEIAGWYNTELEDSYENEWHFEDYRNHTQDGTYSWKFGGEGSINYTNYGHGALVTPELCLGPNAELTFWHWIHAETLNASYAWDGAIVEISTDAGESWSQIVPVGGYGRRIWSNPDSPFDPETPCFAWTEDWTQEEFDLSAYEGRARIRFRFGSDGYVRAEGWYIDDVNVTDDLASVDIDDHDLEVRPLRYALRDISPNPLVSSGWVAFDVPRSSRVMIHVYDVRGRIVDTIADSMFGPGRYSVALDYGRSVVSGVYFVRMRAEGFSQTKKLIVLH
jgi:hypothetical protein